MPARALTRLGALVFVAALSLSSILLLLLPRSRVSIKLQKITLGTSIDGYGDLWGWVSGDDPAAGGLRLIVLGDSWADNTSGDSIGDAGVKKGRNWADVLCEELNCTSHLNFAASQPAEASPSFPPTGALTSNDVYLSSLAALPASPQTLAFDLLPDLSAQVQAFLALPPPNPKPRETIVVVNFGLWDIYHFASLDFTMSQNATDVSVSELFKQLNILYAHHCQDLSATVDLLEHPHPDADPTNGIAEDSTQTSSPFRVIIPKLFDPTLLPGWISQRPSPLAPSTVAEQQKNAVYLTSRWNGLLENKMGLWVNELPKQETPSRIVAEADVSTRGHGQEVTAKPTPVIQREVFYYDTSKFLLDIIIEHQLEDEGLSDASGLGTGESLFESVYRPCMSDGEEDADDGFVDLNGQFVCKEPEEYLFWDNWNLGSVANEAIGREVATMVREGASMRHM